MHKTKLLLLVAIIGGMSLVMLPGSSAAAINSDNTSIAVTPPTFDLTANPGDTENESIMVENVSSQPLNVDTSLEDFVPLGTQGAVNLTTQTSQYSLISWITVSPNSTTIPAHSSANFHVTIQVPINAEPGGKFGSIVFSTGAHQTANSTIAVSQRVGSLILLRIAGQANENARIASFTANPNKKGDNNQVLLDSLIQDLGNVQLKPVGYISVHDFFGHKLANIPFDSKYILPGASRQFPQYWHHGFLFGKYYASITLLYGTSNKIMTSTVSFIVIPWRLIGIVVAIILIVGALLWKGRKRIARSLKILFGKE